MYSSIGINRGNFKKSPFIPPPFTKNLSNHSLKNLSLNGLQVSSAVKNVPYNLYHGGMWKGFGLQKCSQLEEKPFETNSPFFNRFPTIHFFLFPDPTKVKQVNFLSMWDFINLVDISEKINLIIKKWFFFLKSHKSFWKVLQVL